jgi:L-threonylcarbamoyladenylate synthase
VQSGGLKTYLKRGGIIAYPTESCFGLGCDPRNPRALRRLVRLKRRDTAKGMLLIADKLRRLQPYLQPLAPDDRARMLRTWPGPVTWVVPASSSCHPLLTGGRGTIGVRVTAHREAAQLCRGLGTALVSTSANKSGRRATRTAAECGRIFGARVRVIPGRIGARKRPSTLIDLATGTILRP